MNHVYKNADTDIKTTSNGIFLAKQNLTGNLEKKKKGNEILVTNEIRARDTGNGMDSNNLRYQWTWFDKISDGL